MLYFDYSSGVQISDQYSVDVVINRIETVSPLSQEVVLTPVLDASGPMVLQIETRPDGLRLEWRGSNLSFDARDLFPEWQSGDPQTPYRYWQAKVFLTDPHIVLDRIEFRTRGPVSRESHLSFNI